MLRDRPLWFGFVLALGFLNREFTIYALPALLLRDVWSRELWRPARIRTWLLAIVATLATWQGIQALKPFADLMGPGTRGALVGGLGGSQVGNIADRVSLRPTEYPERARRMYGDHLPRLFGATRVEHPIASQGRGWMFWVLSVGLGVPLLRAGWTAARHVGFGTSRFGWYLFAVGTTAAWGYIATRSGEAAVDRYVLLALLIPIGVVAVSLSLERSRVWRGLVIGLVGLWTATSAVDLMAPPSCSTAGRIYSSKRDLIF
jgi:hypothetical protein